MLLWLWRRPAAAALIRPLGWEPPHATGAILKNIYIHSYRESISVYMCVCIERASLGAYIYIYIYIGSVLPTIHTYSMEFYDTQI